MTGRPLKHLSPRRKPKILKEYMAANNKFFMEIELNERRQTLPRKTVQAVSSLVKPIAFWKMLVDISPSCINEIQITRRGIIWFHCQGERGEKIALGFGVEREPGSFWKSGSIPLPFISLWFGVTYFPTVTTTPDPSCSSNTDWIKPCTRHCAW